jgi:hypothetical protein
VSSRSREKVLGGLRIGRIFFTEIGGNLGYLVHLSVGADVLLDRVKLELEG